MKLSVLKNDIEIVSYQSPEMEGINKYEVFIGRSEDCHIHLQDSSISRYHAVLRYSKSGWKLEKNTQFGELRLNGIGIESKEVVSGDTIQIKDYIINVSDIKTESETIEANIPVESETRELTKEILSEESSQDQSLDEPEVDDSAQPEESNDEFAITEEPEQSTDAQDSNEQSSDFSADDDFSSSEEDNFGDSSEGDDFNSEFNDGEGFDNEGFGDEGGFDGESNDSADSTQVFSSFAKFYLILEGEHAPYDRYTIEDNEIFIGRDKEKCQIVLEDDEVSTIHAKIKKTLISCSLEDLNSSNGTLLNGDRINKIELSNGDIFEIGTTKFKLEIESELIQSESSTLMPVEDGQVIEVEEEVEEEVDFDEFDGDFDGEFAMEGEEEESKSLFKNPEKRKKLIYALVGLAVVFLLFGEEENEPAAEQKTTKSSTTSTAKDGQSETTQNQATQPTGKPKKVLTEDEKRFAEQSYQLGKKYYSEGRFAEAIMELNKVDQIDPNYKVGLQTLIDDANERLKRIERRQKELDAIKARKIREKKIETLVGKAKDAVDKREILLAEALFDEILGVDPENIQVTRLKLELEAYQKEIERKELEAARKKAIRDQMVQKLKPGKLHYVKKEWNKAILKLEKFITLKNIDEDLIKEATDMLKESRRALVEKIEPLLGRARSLREGQDLKGAYEAYLDVLEVDPRNQEAIGEISDIKDILENRSKKVYREALISESLSLFKEAKEKFGEVQQISPADSEYYQKATEKLKHYVE